MPEPSKELEAAARAFVAAEWNAAALPEHRRDEWIEICWRQRVDQLRAAFAAVLQEPSPTLVAAVADIIRDAEPEEVCCEETARDTLHAVASHVLGGDDDA